MPAEKLTPAGAPSPQAEAKRGRGRPRKKTESAKPSVSTLGQVPKAESEAALDAAKLIAAQAALRALTASPKEIELVDPDGDGAPKASQKLSPRARTRIIELILRGKLDFQILLMLRSEGLIGQTHTISKRTFARYRASDACRLDFGLLTAEARLAGHLYLSDVLVQAIGLSSLAYHALVNEQEGHLNLHHPQYMAQFNTMLVNGWSVILKHMPALLAHEDQGGGTDGEAQKPDIEMTVKHMLVSLLRQWRDEQQQQKHEQQQQKQRALTVHTEVPDRIGDKNEALHAERG